MGTVTFTNDDGSVTTLSDADMFGDDGHGHALPDKVVNGQVLSRFLAGTAITVASATRAAASALAASNSAGAAAGSAAAATGSAGAAAGSAAASAAEANRSRDEADRAWSEANRAEVAASTLSGATVPDPAPGNAGHVPQSTGSTWGTIPVGTGIGHLVPLVDAGGGVPGLPAVDGSLLTGVGNLPRDHIVNWGGIGKSHKGRLVTLAPAGLIQLTFAEPSQLGAGWQCIVWNFGPSDVRCYFPSALFINDATAAQYTEFLMYPGEARLFQCDGGSIRSLILRPFSIAYGVSGNFHPPPGYSRFEGIAWGAGGGGGRGDHTLGACAAGGGGGACVPFSIPAAEVTANPTAVVVGAGGGGGAGAGYVGGGAGGATEFHGIRAPGGGGGSAGAGAGYGGNGGGLPIASGNVAYHGGGGWRGGYGGWGYRTVEGGGLVGPTGEASVYGGGGGGSCQTSAGGSGTGGGSEFGGGGGGTAHVSNGDLALRYVGQGGGSRLGGVGTRGALDGNAQPGMERGGGGGGAINGSGGSGGRGELQIWGVV